MCLDRRLFDKQLIHLHLVRVVLVLDFLAALHDSQLTLVLLFFSFKEFFKSVNCTFAVVAVTLSGSFVDRVLVDRVALVGQPVEAREAVVRLPESQVQEVQNQWKEWCERKIESESCPNNGFVR
jgi:hypothetical protein